MIADPDEFRCICDPDDLFDPPDPRPRAVAGCPAHRARRAAQRFAGQGRGMDDLDDLVAWIRAQLDKDQQVATKAKTFRYDHPLGAPWERARIAVEQFGGTSSDALIAAMNPDRVLGEVEAKGLLLTEHASMPHEPYCQRCSQDEEQPQPVGYWIPYPCATIKLLALPYAHRPGYRESWRP